MTQISRRNINKGLAWSVPAAVVAGTAPAFAASPTEPTDPPVDPPVRTVVDVFEAESANLTGRAQIHSTALAGQTGTEANGARTYTIESVPNASGQSAVNLIGGGNGTAVFTFSLPTGATDIQLEMLHLAHPNRTVHYIVNGTAFTRTDLTPGGTGFGNQSPTTDVLNASELEAGSNTIVFGNPTSVPFGYLDAIRVTYTAPIPV